MQEATNGKSKPARAGPLPTRSLTGTPNATENSCQLSRKSCESFSPTGDLRVARIEILKSLPICQTLQRTSSGRMPSTISIWQCHAKSNVHRHSIYLRCGKDL